MLETFQPPLLFRNRHLQSALSSVPLRKRLLARQHTEFETRTTTHHLDAGEGVILTGLSNLHENSEERPCLILIHGWEGSANSGYVYSAATFAFAHGYNVFRLNLRDHGESHHLNHGLFHSARLREVTQAVIEVQRKIKAQSYCLAGFSLGGNFALRVSAKISEMNSSIAATVAVCPVINPYKSSQALEKSLFIYEKYFVKKWKRSLKKKLKHFPDYDYEEAIEKYDRLNELNNYLIPKYTKYESLSDYFSSYALSKKWLNKITNPTLVIASEDDPVIPIEDIKALKDSMSSKNHIEFDIQRHGSHCAFLKNINKHSWADERLIGFCDHKLSLIERS